MSVESLVELNDSAVIVVRPSRRRAALHISMTWLKGNWDSPSTCYVPYSPYPRVIWQGVRAAGRRPEHLLL